IPQPNENLGVRAGTHAEQTAEVLRRLEPVVARHRPDLVLVYGDVNSTMAAALVGAKSGVAVGHVGAGLRSFDRTMPEEINRIVTDQLADVLFTPSADGDENLRREGIPATRIHRVGNVMIDTLVRCLPLARRPAFGVPERYALVTLHRPPNVGDDEHLLRLLGALAVVGRDLPVLFPVHPRTRQRVEKLGSRVAPSDDVRLVEPLGYLEFLHLQQHAAVVITDSGGIQEETTFLGV